MTLTALNYYIQLVQDKLVKSVITILLLFTLLILYLNCNSGFAQSIINPREVCQRERTISFIAEINTFAIPKSMLWLSI